MNVQSIDLSDELRPGVQSCLAVAPVVFRSPIARERLSRRELYALRSICDRLSFRPLCIVDAPAQFGKFRLGNIHVERPNSVLVDFLFTDSWCHGVLHLSSVGNEGAIAPAKRLRFLRRTRVCNASQYQTTSSERKPQIK